MECFPSRPEGGATGLGRDTSSQKRLPPGTAAASPQGWVHGVFWEEVSRPRPVPDDARTRALHIATHATREAHIRIGKLGRERSERGRRNLSARRASQSPSLFDTRSATC